MMITTATYPNRLEDKAELESKLHLSEFGDEETEFYAPNQFLARGYVRIVYGDHGPYLEFRSDQLKTKLNSKFNNDIDRLNLPEEGDCKYYYYWLHPDGHSNIKVYLQLKSVCNLPNAPRRADGKKSNFNRHEGYADYRRGMFYVNPYQLETKGNM